MPSDNLILIGFMATGKSTIGRICADLLGYEFQDTDEQIVKHAGMSVPEIFAAEGEAGFRAREREMIARLTMSGRQVIATGGGAVLDRDNARRLCAAGSVVGLLARPETVLRRVGDTATRPLLRSARSPAKRIESMMSERLPIYREVAGLCFDTDDGSPQDIADRIVTRYRAEARRQRRPIRIEVGLAERSYPIIIAEGLISGAADLIYEVVPCQAVCIVTHPGLRTRYAGPIEEGLRRQDVDVTTVSIPAGERHKSLKTVSRLYDAFVDARLDRKGVVIAVGGGVLGDTAGFAAASYLRGVRIVQVPTTLLAQVDSSVGGKTGVDLPAGKNLIGAFHQPSLVVVDPSTLSTLPMRELRSGLAEVIKYGIIYDAAFFAEIVGNGSALLNKSHELLVRAIARSCEIKAEVVSQDETEQGLRAILNFGHTVGHALETITEYRRYKHGEAVSIGMVSAALIGEVLGVTPATVTRSIKCALTEVGLPTVFPADIEFSMIISAAQHDKKTEAGKMRFVLARAIGDVYVHNDVPDKAVKEALVRQCRGGASID